jgi:hypothetical protein
MDSPWTWSWSLGGGDSGVPCLNKEMWFGNGLPTHFEAPSLPARRLRGHYTEVREHTSLPEEGEGQRRRWKCER